MKHQSSPKALYFVRASSLPNRFYAVGEFPGSRQQLRCECLAGQFGRRCWHVDAVAAGMVAPVRLKRVSVVPADQRATAADLYA